MGHQRFQEPTDFGVMCEWSGFPIPPESAHLGLGWDVALGALDLDRHEPIRTLPADARRFFWADDVLEPAGRFEVLLVLEGDARLDGQHARAGDAFVVPAAAERIEVEGDVRVLRCLAPTP